MFLFYFSGATGDRLKEGANINQSLLTLGLRNQKLPQTTILFEFFDFFSGNVISALADQQGGKKKVPEITLISLNITTATNFS